MRFSVTASVFALFTLATAVVPFNENRSLEARQNAGRPVPSGACCTPNTSLKQDVCNVSGSTGRCVPGDAKGTNCKFSTALENKLKMREICWWCLIGNGALNCVADAALTCDAKTLERGRPLCRATWASDLNMGDLMDWGAQCILFTTQINQNWPSNHLFPENFIESLLLFKCLVCLRI